MKIISVTAHPLRTELETPFAFSQGWVRARSATLVEVRTDDGLVGWGEAFCQGLEVPEISATIVRDCLAEMIIGENPLDTERLWFAMYNRSRDFGRKGSVMAAISAIDTALWDIAGKAYGKPVWQLLGGAFRRERVLRRRRLVAPRGAVAARRRQRRRAVEHAGSADR